MISCHYSLYFSTAKRVTITVTLTVYVGYYVSGTWFSTGMTSSTDWIGLYGVNDVVGLDSSKWRIYVGSGKTSGTFVTSTTTNSAAWKVPASGGPYVFRAFCCDGYLQYGQSSSFGG